MILLLGTVLFISCDQGESYKESATTSFNNELTEEEIAGGVMTPELMWKFRRLGDIVLSPDGSNILYTLTDIDLKTEARRTNIYKMAVSGGDPVQLTTGGGNSPQWIDGGKSILYANGNTLVIMNADGSEKIEIKGLDNFEHFSLSPAGDKIYFTRRVKMDQTSNEKYGFEKAKVRIINDLMYRHWDSWSDYSYSHLFIASFDGRKVYNEKDVMEGQRFETPMPPFFDAAEITWSPDGKQIAYTSKRLTGAEFSKSTNSDIYLYDIENSTEINISAGNKGYDRYPVFSPDGSKIAFQSMERDGYESDLDRLFVYDISSGTRRWATQGWDFDVENITWVDNENIWFTCAYLGTVQIFKTNLSTRGIDKVTEGMFDLGPLRYNNGTLLAGIVSMSMAPEISKVDMATGQVELISSINKNIYDNIKMGKTEERYIKTGDNQDLQMWVIYPPDFDPNKTYPMLLYCKGGPQGPLSQSWSYRWNYQMMAAKGYIVVAPNRRGNTGFGQSWKEQISGDYGGANMRDYLDAVDAMCLETYVDKDRLGAVGASYGGYSVFYLAGIHADRFKAFVSHCGMFDFTSWYGSTEELWFAEKDIEGAYWNNPKSYDYSPHLRVDQWNTPILIITGANDFRIPYTQSLEAFQAAQLKEIPSRLLFFEDESHWVTKPQNSVIWQKEFFEWLDMYLQ